MNLLAISGSARLQSTNTALLRALAAVAPDGIAVTVFDRIGDLPVFSPDLEGERTPPSVRAFMDLIATSDGLIVSSPEYVRTLPGGLKNAIDWLVSGDAIVGKPIALAHASHRGDDMLATLRTVLSTVSGNFNAELFLRFPLMKSSPDTIAAFVADPPNRYVAETYLRDVATFCRQCRDPESGAWPIDP